MRSGGRMTISYAEYPASAEEALAAEQLDRRLPWAWVKGCVEEKGSVAANVPGDAWDVLRDVMSGAPPSYLGSPPFRG